MADKNNKKRLWIQNLLNRYRLVVINEKTFNEEFSLRLSRLNIILTSILLIAFIFIGSIFLVAYTPLKEFIPGYTSTKLRKEAIRNSFLLDSLYIDKLEVGVLLKISLALRAGDVGEELRTSLVARGPLSVVTTSD